MVAQSRAHCCCGVSSVAYGTGHLLVGFEPRTAALQVDAETVVDLLERESIGDHHANGDLGFDPRQPYRAPAVPGGFHRGPVDDSVVGQPSPACRGLERVGVAAVFCDLASFASGHAARVGARSLPGKRSATTGYAAWAGAARARGCH